MLRAVHTPRHLPHEVHFCPSKERTGAFERLSGLWHQMHLRGQPFKNTQVRIPSPSCIQNFCMLNIKPISDLSILAKK